MRNEKLRHFEDLVAFLPQTKPHQSAPSEFISLIDVDVVSLKKQFDAPVEVVFFVVLAKQYEWSLGY
jgi:hypothetical protein